MARIVRISTIGAQGPAPGNNHRETLERVVDHLETVLGNALGDRPDFILLPETCDMPWFPRPEDRHDFCAFKGDRVDRLIRDICRENRVNICYGSFRDGGDGWYRNSAVFVDREGGTVGIYNKNHLVLEEFTESRVRYGREPRVVEMDFGRVGAAICYDLQFDELREAYRKLAPELMVFPSLFPGGFLKRNWAFSNRCWLVSSLGMGGQSCEIVNPLGETVARSSYYLPHMTAEINLDCCLVHLDYNRERIVRMQRALGPDVKVEAPSGLGRALITSCTDRVSAAEITEAFGIERMDDLFARNLASRNTPGHTER